MQQSSKFLVMKIDKVRYRGDTNVKRFSGYFDSRIRLKNGNMVLARYRDGRLRVLVRSREVIMLES